MKSTRDFLPAETRNFGDPADPAPCSPANRACAKPEILPKCDTSFSGMNARKSVEGIPRSGSPAILSSGRSLLVNVAVACIAFLYDPSSHAQNSPATLPNVHISQGGGVGSIVVQDDGKIVVSGSFSSVNGVPRVNIARINVDGSVDETWNPQIDGQVFAVAVSGTDLYVGGCFRRVGDQNRT